MATLQKRKGANTEISKENPNEITGNFILYHDNIDSSRISIFR